MSGPLEFTILINRGQSLKSRDEHPVIEILATIIGELGNPSVGIHHVDEIPEAADHFGVVVELLEPVVINPGDHEERRDGEVVARVLEDLLGRHEIFHHPIVVAEDLVTHRIVRNEIQQRLEGHRITHGPIHHTPTLLGTVGQNVGHDREE